MPGPPIEDPKRKRKELAGRLGKEISDRREEMWYSSGRHYAETIAELNNLSFHLSTRPETVPAYQLKLYPFSLERSALLASSEFQERFALGGVKTAYEEERQKVEDEWKKGRERIRERLLEGIEERRRRAREEKDGDGTVGDGAMDSQSRPHITRKLRNKLGGGTSPPPTPLVGTTPNINGITSISSGPVTSVPFNNPHSLSVDELPSPYPLPLTSTHPSAGGSYGGPVSQAPSKRRAKGGAREAQALGGLGKSMQVFAHAIRESEIEHDLGIIRRQSKRRRAAASTAIPSKS